MDHFHRQAEERRHKIDAGESVEPQFEVDMDQLNYTQRVTRGVIDAEAEYEEAKAAALAGGIELSDVESGFLDQPDDGYRVSSEDEEATSIDRRGIQIWVERLPGAESELWNTWLASQAALRCSEMLAGGVEVDNWDAKPIEICDSASMVAEGPWRRRIDKWRAMCGLE